MLGAILWLPTGGSWAQRGLGGEGLREQSGVRGGNSTRTALSPPDRRQLGSGQAGHTPGASRAHRQWSVTSQRGHTEAENSHCGAGSEPLGTDRQQTRAAQAGSQTGQVNKQAGSPSGRHTERQIGGQIGCQSHSGRSRQTFEHGAHQSLNRETSGCTRGSGCHPCPSACAELEEEDVVRAPRQPRPHRRWLLPRESEKEVGGGPAP